MSTKKTSTTTFSSLNPGQRFSWKGSKERLIKASGSTYVKTNDLGKKNLKKFEVKDVKKKVVR